jgi:hypothetical protein
VEFTQAEGLEVLMLQQVLEHPQHPVEGEPVVELQPVMVVQEQLILVVAEVVAEALVKVLMVDQVSF